jgi:hypothetical protein
MGKGLIGIKKIKPSPTMNEGIRQNEEEISR